MRSTFAGFFFAALAFGQVSPPEQRVADLTELIERKPDFAAAYYARGVTHLSAGQYAPAEADLSKAIELKPDASKYASRAEVYAATQRPDPAIADLSLAINLKPDNGTYYLRRANSYRTKGACDRAVADYSEAIRKSMTEEAFRGRAACRKQIGDKAGAAADEQVLAGMERLRSEHGPVTPRPAAPATDRAAVPPSVPVPATGQIPQGVYRVGGAVSPPSIIFKVEPVYSEEARKAKAQGVVTLSIVVDEFGEARNMKVARALGLGLDEAAMEAVQQWVFKPGRKDGQPVAVYATIQVTFNLL